MTPLQFRLLLPLGVGAAIGLVAGAANAAVLLAFFGFWGGLMWLLLITGPLGFWYSARRQKARGEAVTFATGVALGLLPGAWYDWYANRGLNGGEVWFPVLLAFLIGLTFAPTFIGIRRLGKREAAT